jgi:Pyruvate/2-oxoacid:ferredoxin oxidoreductase delta subunit
MNEAGAANPPPRLCLDESQCIGCAVCVDVCPSGAFEMGPEDAIPRWLPTLCNGCRICERQCPTEAISVRRPHRGAHRSTAALRCPS